MAGKIVTIAQQKGGAGKTTLVAHLAVAWNRHGWDVAVCDIDPQGSLSQWMAARAETLGAAGLSHSRVSGWRTQREVETLARDHDVVLIDSPPHAETEAKIAVRSADLVVIPIQPSPMDLWATKPTIDLALSERRPVLLVLNRVPPRARMIETLIEKASQIGVPIASTRIGNRVAFAQSMMDGLTCLEAGRGSAAKEITDLANEIATRFSG